MLAGREGVARTAVAAFGPRRRVCLETRGMHERAMSGPPFMTFDRVCTSYKGRSGSQDNIQAVLIFATGLKITEGGTQSNNKIAELANDGHGEHRASREAVDGADCGR